MQSGYQTTAIHQRQQQQEQAMAEQAFPMSQDHNFHHLLQQQLLFQQPNAAQRLYFHNPHQYVSFSPHYYQQQQMQESEGCGNVGVAAGERGSFPLVNFMLGNLNESSGANGENILSEEEEDILLLRGSQQQYAIAPSSQPSSLPISNCWHNQEDSAIKQPLWKPISTDVLDSNYNKICRENTDKEEQQMASLNKGLNYSEQVFGSDNQTKVLENKCKLINELEAMYQTGFGSVLSIDNPPTNDHLPNPIPFNHKNNLNTAANPTSNGNIEMVGVEAIDEDSEASIRKAQKRKRKKKSDELHLPSTVKFFEELVKRLMDHQEGLHMKFLEVVERLDGERKAREETWRQNQLAKLQCEASDRAHERALASRREAIIVSYLEKITGQSIELPARPPSEAETMNELCTTERSSNDGTVPKADVCCMFPDTSDLDSNLKDSQA